MSHFGQDSPRLSQHPVQLVKIEAKVPELAAAGRGRWARVGHSSAERNSGMVRQTRGQSGTSAAACTCLMWALLSSGWRCGVGTAQVYLPYSCIEAAAAVLTHLVHHDSLPLLHTVPYTPTHLSLPAAMPLTGRESILDFFRNNMVTLHLGQA